jgi:hypothetical protein
VWNGNFLLIALTVVVGYSCGSGSSPSAPTPSPTPRPSPVPIVVDQTSGVVCWGCVNYRPFTITRPGTIEVRLTWTRPTTWLTVAIRTSACDGHVPPSPDCKDLVWDSEPGAPARKTITLPNAAAGTYVVTVHCVQPGDESYSYQVILTPTE